jgi:hypothetical protein
MAFMLALWIFKHDRDEKDHAYVDRVGVWWTAVFDRKDPANPERGESGTVHLLLTVVDLADGAVIGVADDRGVRWPRPRVAAGAIFGWLMGCSAR